MSIAMVFETVAKLDEFEVVHLMHRQTTSWSSMKFSDVHEKIPEICFIGHASNEVKYKLLCTFDYFCVEKYKKSLYSFGTS